MIKHCVVGIPALLEPSTAASAAAEYARFLCAAALGTCVLIAYHGYTYCRGRFCERIQNLARHHTKTTKTNTYAPTNRHCAYMVGLPCVILSKAISFNDTIRAITSGTRVSLSTTHLCRPGCLRPMCDQTVSRRHLHSSETKRRRECNNSVCRISWSYHTWNSSYCCAPRIDSSSLMFLCGNVDV